jgi:hypothetical protein
MKHLIQPTFLRNEGVGKLYKATINQAELGVVTGMQVKLIEYEYVALGALPLCASLFCVTNWANR